MTSDNIQYLVRIAHGGFIVGRNNIQSESGVKLFSDEVLEAFRTAMDEDNFDSLHSMFPTKVMKPIKNAIIRNRMGYPTMQEKDRKLLKEHLLKPGVFSMFKNQEREPTMEEKEEFVRQMLNKVLGGDFPVFY